jgi:hypothetical protein
MPFVNRFAFGGQATAPINDSVPMTSTPVRRVTRPLSPPDTTRSHSPPPPAHYLDDFKDVGARKEPDSSQAFDEAERNNISGGSFQNLARRALKADRRGRASSQSLGYRSADGTGEGRRMERPRKKWLVLIVPPMALPHSPPPAQVRSTFSSLAFPSCTISNVRRCLQVSGFANGYGASGRFSGGILLPLQATVSCCGTQSMKCYANQCGQLSAQISLVAREFSLPSIAGVSLYLCLPSQAPHWSASGISTSNEFPFPTAPPSSAEGLKPRLVEEIWSTLWFSHLDEELCATAEGMKGVNGMRMCLAYLTILLTCTKFGF